MGSPQISVIPKKNIILETRKESGNMISPRPFFRNLYTIIF